MFTFKKRAEFITVAVKIFISLNPSYEGGLGQPPPPPPMISKTGGHYNLQLSQVIRTIYERSKTGRVDDLSLVRFPW